MKGEAESFLKGMGSVFLSLFLHERLKEVEAGSFGLSMAVTAVGGQG